MRVVNAGILAALAVATLGCARTFHAEAVQPNPMAMPGETLRSSEKVTIVTGDMELEKPYDPDPGQRATTAINHRYPLINQASFTMVSRDRLRFHVQIDHKWEEWADLTSWDVHLEDDQGHAWAPEAVEHAQTRLISEFWDREQRTSVCSAAGRDGTGQCITTIGVLDDGWKHRQTFGTLSVFRGKADFVFYQRDLMRPDVRKLRLVVKRPSEVFEFTWRFRDAVASDTAGGGSSQRQIE
ncbi:MAG: hypothetical protein E6J91_15985 [Deltaproteobacteria bacterium]|nr:MAG: hypothetical protein E6J91_15985 [Deltaproteobacteria bacterium]